MWQPTVVQAPDLHVNVCTREQYVRHCCIVCIATCSCCSSAIKYFALCVSQLLLLAQYSNICWWVIPTHWKLLHIFPHSRHTHYMVAAVLSRTYGNSNCNPSSSGTIQLSHFWKVDKVEQALWQVFWLASGLSEESEDKQVSLRVLLWRASRGVSSLN